MTKRKLLISLLIFLLYEVAVWFGTSALAAPANFLLIVFILSALGLTVLIVYMLISRLAQRSAPPPPPPASGGDQQQAAAPARGGRSGQDPELDAISALMTEANNRLAQSPTLASRRIRTNVFTLPLYLLGGPEGTGKTSTFLKSGLEPELLAGQVYRDASVLPTRHANFWFASDALFVEPSGSLFSQDAGRWAGLIDRLQGKSAGSFLRKLFPSRNAVPRLRGFVLFVDIAPFMGVPDPGRVSNLSRRIQERLRQVGERSGVNYPVYVVFTKSDALPYFAEYFGRLTETEDQQILGCTLPAMAPGSRPAGEVFAEAETTRLADFFNNLYYSLADKRLAFLPRETAPEKKPAMYEFPREVKRVRDTLIQFLVDVFRPNPLQPGPILRGFYFTGTRAVSVSTLTASTTPQTPQARQASGEATSLFNVEEYQKRMGLTAEPASSTETTMERWCFVSELFHRVVLGDTLAVKVGFANRRQDMRRRILFGTAAFVGLLFCFLFIRSWWGNSSLLGDVSEAAGASYAFQPNMHALPSVETLRGMEGLRQQLETLLDYNRDGAPWHLRWGLYAGNRVLPGTYDLYFQRFRQVFYDDFQQSLAATLMRLPSAPDNNFPYNDTYDKLKAYRMITQCKCTPDKAFLAPVLNQVWLNNRAIDPERQALAEKQIDFYAEELGYKNPYKVPEMQEATDRGRQYLSSFGGVERIYRGIVEQASKMPRRPADLAELAPNYRQVLSTPGQVQAAFTRDGFAYAEKAIKDPNRAAMGEPCVLGGSGTMAAASQLLHGGQIEAELQNMYVQDYIKKWRDFTSATSVIPFRNADDAAKKLNLLADNRSPLLAAVFLIADNTNFPSVAAPAAAPPSGLLNRMLPSKARQAAGAATAISKQLNATQGPVLTPGDITTVFQPARQVVNVQDRDRLISDPNRSYMNALANLQQAMTNLAGSQSGAPDVSLNTAAKNAVDQGLDTVRQLSQSFNINGSQGFDGDVKRLLDSPFQEASRFIVTDFTKLDRDKANGAMKQLCAKFSALERKFPFNPQSDNDASPDEVAGVFAPGSGALAGMEQQLSKLIVKQGNVWVQSPQASDPKPTPEFLQFVNRMSQVQDALYAGGSTQLQMHYTLRPTPGQNVQAITLDIDGQKITATGKPEAKQFLWPGPAGSQATVVTVKAGANIPFGSYEGLWSVFRLMYDTDPHPAGSRSLEWSHVRQGHGQPQTPTDAEGKPITMRIDVVEFPNGVDVFDKSFFNIRCPGRAAQ
jgi:type VI secretion system protein ImpL